MGGGGAVYGTSRLPRWADGLCWAARKGGRSQDLQRSVRGQVHVPHSAQAMSTVRTRYILRIHKKRHFQDAQYQLTLEVRREPLPVRETPYIKIRSVDISVCSPHLPYASYSLPCFFLLAKTTQDHARPQVTKYRLLSRLGGVLFLSPSHPIFYFEG